MLPNTQISIIKKLDKKRLDIETFVITDNIEIQVKKKSHSNSYSSRL